MSDYPKQMRHESLGGEVSVLAPPAPSGLVPYAITDDDGTVARLEEAVAARWGLADADQMQTLLPPLYRLLPVSREKA